MYNTKLIDALYKVKCIQHKRRSYTCVLRQEHCPGHNRNIDNIIQLIDIIQGINSILCLYAIQGQYCTPMLCAIEVNADLTSAQEIGYCNLYEEWWYLQYYAEKFVWDRR